MTEDEWMRSDNPVKMGRFIESKITRRQKTHFVQACRHNEDPKKKTWGYDLDREVDTAFNGWHSGTFLQPKCTPEFLTDLFREIIGNPYKECSLLKQIGNMRQCERCQCVFDRELQIPKSCPECGEHDLICKWRYVNEYRRWDGGTILKMAQHIYEDNAWDEMPILCDAYEAAGGTDPEIIEHARQTHRGRYVFAGATGSFGHFETRAAAEKAAKGLDEHYHGLANIYIGSPLHVRGCWLIDAILG